MRFLKNFLFFLYILFLNILIVNDGFTKDRDSTITIIAAGDLMLGSWVEQVIADSGFAYPFKDIYPFTSDSDIFFANLEAPFGTKGEAFAKKYTFQVSPALIKVLIKGGVNLVSLGNNHIMDYGVESLKETIELLTRYKISFAGAGLNLFQARQPAILQVKGKKVGFLSYSLTFPEEFWATDTSAGTCFPYEEFVFQDVKELAQKTDLVIVSCHWGQELMNHPKEYQILLAHQLIDKGADIILGHHPHVIQGIEFYKGKPIVYSMGNFIFGSYSERAKESFLLKITWHNEEVMNFQILPISVYNKEVEFQPRRLQDADRELFFQNFKAMLRELNSDSIVISNDGLIKVFKTS